MHLWEISMKNLYFGNLNTAHLLRVQEKLWNPNLRGDKFTTAGSHLLSAMILYQNLKIYIPKSRRNLPVKFCYLLIRLNNSNTFTTLNAKSILGCISNNDKVSSKHILIKFKYKGF